MAEIRGMSHTCTNHLAILSTGVRNSIKQSLGYMNSQTPLSNLKLRPSFITAQVINEAKKLLKSYEKGYSMLVVDICSYGVALSIITVHGCANHHLIEVSKEELKQALCDSKSGEQFLGLIAQKCYNLVKANLCCFKNAPNQTIPCSIVLRFECDHISLAETIVTKWARDFILDDCLGKDLAKLLNEHLKVSKCDDEFTIECTNLIEATEAPTTGICIQQQDMPDIFVNVNRGTNICFFDDQHNLKGHIGQKMIINTQISRFGDFASSNDNDLLRRFLELVDFEVNKINKDETQMLGKLTSAFWVCTTVKRFIANEIPDLFTKFPWLSSSDGISVSDISNLLLSDVKNKQFDSRLMLICDEFNGAQKQRLINLCHMLVKRSSKIMAAVTYGFVKILSPDPTDDRKIVIALSGAMMTHMYGYKASFKSTMKALQTKCEEKPIKIEYIEADDKSMNFGIAAVSKYLEQCK